MRILLALPLAILAGCTPSGTEGPASPERTAARAQPVATPSEAAAPSRTAAYTSLENCKVVREERTEMPYTETRCAGPAGWALRIADADARQTLTVLPPEGRETRLDTARIGGGGFSGFGKTAEWRGAAGPEFSPDALIVRFRVAEQPHPAPETAYLLAIRLAPEPCIVAHIPPDPDQNVQARAAADRGGACLAD